MSRLLREERRRKINQRAATVSLVGWLSPCFYCGTLTSSEVLFFLFAIHFDTTKKIACCQRYFGFKKYKVNIPNKVGIAYKWSSHLNVVAVF